MMLRRVTLRRMKEPLQVGAALILVLVTALACRKRSAATDAGPPLPTVATATATVAEPVATDLAVLGENEKSTYTVGQKIDVMWKGSSYPCTVLAVLPNDHYKIHYVGWGANWDETVGLDRIVGAKGAPAPTAKPTALGGGGGGGGGSTTPAPCPGPGITRRCGGVCVNLQTDDHNCGSCGTVCSGGKHCDGHLFCRDSEGNL
ncbi:hypothetical protein BH09MYX1_BH09MYX1_27720 [soil metagenome]